MPLLGTAHGVPVTLVSVDEARATPIWLDKPVVTRPYTPRPSGRASRAPASGLDAYSDAVLHESLACLRAYHAAQPDWWTCQARALCIAARPPCELAACVEAAEREPGTSRWAHVLHTNDTDAEVQVRREARCTYVLPPRSAFLLTDLLPAQRREPHGWASVRALGMCTKDSPQCTRMAVPRSWWWTHRGPIGVPSVRRATTR